MGAYRVGSDVQLDQAIAKHAALVDYLSQNVQERCSFAHSVAALKDLLGDDA